MKKSSLLLLSLLLSGVAYPMGKKAPEGLSLLLVPARPAMVQLGLDMAAREHALLMTYAPETSVDALFIHIWDGAKWLQVPQLAFENGSFVRNRVARLLVVGGENPLTAALLEKALIWSPEVLHLGSDNVTELINQMGRLYEFDRRDWEWVAQRYALQLEDLNQGRVQSSWYDQNKASELPPSDAPWKKPAQTESAQPPETSLTPLMPPGEPLVPAVPVVPLPEADAPAAPSTSTGTPDSDPVDFSLEVE